MKRVATLQGPVDLSAATRVGPRVYRKQVLAKRTIDYPLPGGKSVRVDFNDEYLRDLAAAYNDGAYDLVPFQLASPANEHNEDPRQYGGKVLGAEVTPDGLDLILELSQEAADLVEKTGRTLGVSPRIKAVRHVDGRMFKRAIRHVLGTLDPRMTGMRPWEPVVDLSDPDDDPVLYPKQEGVTMPRIIDLSQLEPEALETLETYAALNGIDLSDAEVAPEDEPGSDEPDETPDGTPDGEPAGGDADEPDPDGVDTPGTGDGDAAGDGDDDDPSNGDDTITDDELEALIDAELDGVELSADDDADLDLATGLTGVDGDERQADRIELAQARFQLAAQGYARRGVPPALIDLAEPVLSLTDEQAATIDLASPATGEAIDVRGIVRNMLDTVAGTIDLSGEAGYGHETEPDEQVTNLASAWTEYLENN